MSDALDVLCDRVRTLRDGREDIERASITFLPDETTNDRGRYKARVRVDGRPAVSVGPKGWTIAVEPGEHRVRIRFATRTGLETEKNATIVRTVLVGPGDRVMLACGVDREAERELRDHEARVMQWFVNGGLAWVAALAAGMLFPPLREAVVALMIRLGAGGPVGRMVSPTVRSWIAAMVFAGVTGQVVSMISSISLRRQYAELRSRFPSLFYVEPKGKRPLADEEFGS